MVGRRHVYGSDRALIAEAALLGNVLRVEEAKFYNREHPSRSIRMSDHAERSQWQDTSTSTRKSSMEHMGLFLHLMEIAGRHGDRVSTMAARKAVLKFAMTPVQGGRLVLDLVRYVSPGLARQLRRIGPLVQRRSVDVS